MSLTRQWPAPLALDRTFHLVGDVQGVPYLGDKANRADQVLDDMARPSVPKVAHTLQVGDFVGTTPDANFAPTKAFMDTVAGDGDWYAVVGNHDHDRVGTTYRRTPDAAAALMGMPGQNYVIDLGYIVLVGIFVWAWGKVTRTDEANPTWLADTLDEYPDRTVMVMAHPPLLGLFLSQIGGWGNMRSDDDTAIRTIIDSRPQVKAYLCGHTHSPLIHPVATTISTGTRNLAHINASALLNTMPGVDWSDPIHSLYVTVNDDSLDVRFRDHGTHQWKGGSTTSSSVVTLPI